MHEHGGEQRMRLAPILLSVLFLGAVAFLARSARRFRRYAVEGESMAPALQAGDWLLVDLAPYRSTIPRRGHIVMAYDPRDRRRTLVKRVESVSLHGDIELRGDNPNASTDSRTFGPLHHDALLGRVRWRYWPPARVGPVR